MFINNTNYIAECTQKLSDENKCVEEEKPEKMLMLITQIIKYKFK